MTELHHWLRLHHCKRAGAATASKLLTHFGDLETVFRADKAGLSASGISKAAMENLLEAPDESAIERDLNWAHKADNHIIPFASERYPARLRSISHAPVVIYVIGDAETLHTPQLAMVGSRKASIGGKEAAFEFARHIASAGITITSGLALGVDAASHEGALAGKGLTIAVAATGLDRIYPGKNRDLATRIIEEGALVSEFPIGTMARPEYFPRRNRIISGLSIGTLVVEAAVRSGSLTTARHAVEQGREVFAIPGSIQNPMARGCHKLIKEGAKLIESADEILEELAPQFGPLQSLFNAPLDSTKDKQIGAEPQIDDLDPSYQTILNCIDYNPQPIDVIIERSGFSAAEVASMLLMLELNGKVVRAEGNKYSRR